MTGAPPPVCGGLGRAANPYPNPNPDSPVCGGCSAGWCAASPPLPPPPPCRPGPCSGSARLQPGASSGIRRSAWLGLRQCRGAAEHMRVGQTVTLSQLCNKGALKVYRSGGSGVPLRQYRSAAQAVQERRSGAYWRPGHAGHAAQHPVSVCNRCTGVPQRMGAHGGAAPTCPTTL